MRMHEDIYTKEKNKREHAQQCQKHKSHIYVQQKREEIPYGALSAKNILTDLGVQLRTTQPSPHSAPGPVRLRCQKARGLPNPPAEATRKGFHMALSSPKDNRVSQKRLPVPCARKHDVDNGARPRVGPTAWLNMSTPTSSEPWSGCSSKIKRTVNDSPLCCQIPFKSLPTPLVG